MATSYIKLDPVHPFRIPTATSDQQVQAMIDAAVTAERERCIAVIRAELVKNQHFGAGWTWETWRNKMLAALGSV